MISNITHVQLEASSICQLKCPCCNTSSGENKPTIGRGCLKFKNFKKFVDENPNVKNIELSNYGEIFLNPELKDIIKYAFIQKIDLTARNGVNLNGVTREVLECLVKYQFKLLYVSIDGASDETYQIYRKGGNFGKVISNIKIINQYKNQYNSDLPKLGWQFVIFGHNEHELPLARKMARELNMSFHPKLNWDASFAPVKDKEFVRKESRLGVANREEFKQKNKEDYILPCNQLWNCPTINWDGRLLGCCCNSHGDFGVNVFELNLDQCLKSEKYVYAKEMLFGNKPSRSDIPCSKCSNYPRFIKSRLKKDL